MWINVDCFTPSLSLKGHICMKTVTVSHLPLSWEDWCHVQGRDVFVDALNGLRRLTMLI